jgi:hypothetical protein
MLRTGIPILKPKRQRIVSVMHACLATTELELSPGLRLNLFVYNIS